MTPYEILLSESQERMLLVARAGAEDAVREVFARWDLDAVVIGRVTDDGVCRVRWRRRGGRARCRSTPLTDDAPVYDRPAEEPARLEELQRLDLATVARARRLQRRRCWRCSRVAEPRARGEWVYRQYDQLVGGNTVVRPGGDAAVVRVEGTRQGARADASTATAATALLDPYVGAMRAVVEAARNVVGAGARAARAHRLPQLRQPREARGHVAVPAGDRAASATPASRSARRSSAATSASTTRPTGRSIPPTPTIAHGRPARRRRRQHVTQWFKSEGDVDRAARPHARGARRQRVPRGASTASVRGAPPWIDLEAEKRLQRVVLEAVARAARCARRTTSPRAASRWRSPSAASAARGSARGWSSRAACGPTRCCSARARRACWCRCAAAT